MKGLEVDVYELSENAHGFILLCTELDLTWLLCIALLNFLIGEHVLKRGSEFDAVANGVEGVDAVAVIPVSFRSLLFYGENLPVEILSLMITLILK